MDGLERTQQYLSPRLVGGVGLCFNPLLSFRLLLEPGLRARTNQNLGRGIRPPTPAIVSTTYFSTSEAAFSPPRHRPFNNRFPSPRTAPSRLRLYGGLMSAEDKHLGYQIINILIYQLTN